MRKQYLTVAMAALSVAAITSCNEELDLVAGTSTDAAGKEFLEKVTPAYTHAFVDAFGEIDPSNGFGMNEPLQRMGWGGSKTRAAAPTEKGSGRVLVNRNEWVKHQDNDMSKPYADDALAHDIVIPGWPNFDGRYYGNFGGSVIQNMWTEGNVPNGAQPCGDITDFEIQYVSAWFRSNRITNPEQYREKLHLSDFFIQNVSCDNDQVAYNSITSSTKTGSNGANVLTGNDQGAYNNIKRNNGSHETVNFSLDQLCFQDMDGKWTHVNNFNNQNSNYNPEEAKETNNRELKYITSAGTENFMCHPSFSTKAETNWIDSWVLVHLTWEEPLYNNASTFVKREGYYLAFDFQAKKDETEVSCDGYYSNWIIKITPGHFSPTGNARRIMCEDLGGQFDFDFNDVVVDVALDNDGYPVFSVQAAGGTMPIYLDDRTDSKYEIHYLMGAESTQPVNVMGDYSHQHAPAIFRGKDKITGTYTAADVKIRVKNGDKEYYINGDRANLDKNTYGSPTNKIGTEAPRSFSVETTDVKWMKELQFIDKSYPGFKNWVADAEWRYQPSESAPKLKWYEQSEVQADTDPVTSYKYYPGIKLENGSPQGWAPTLPTSWTTLDLAAETATHASEAEAFGSVWIDGYTGVASIIDNLKNNNAQQITLTVILKSKTKYPDPVYTTDANGAMVLSNGAQLLQAILIPADIKSDIADNPDDYNGKKMKYQNNYFDKNVISQWRVAQLQDYRGQDENSLIDTPDAFAGYDNTYAIKMTFEREQLLQTTSPEDFVNHIFLFVKSPDNADVKVFNWHVHY